VTFNSSRPGLLDACAAVKLVVTEEGSKRLLKTFSGGSFFITSFCLFEVLGVLKRKWTRGQIIRDHDHYLQCCFSLFGYVNQKRFNISDPEINSYETFRLADELTKKYSLDLSDTLLLVGLKCGLLSRFMQESKATLVTADGDLETAAKAEGLRVWNCLKQETPPEQID
jgi:predicted nucleic acid-binding protein